MPVAGGRLPVGDGARASLLPLPRRTTPDEPPRRPFSIFRRPIPVYPGLSRFIPVYPGLFRFIPVYSGLSWSIQVYLGLSRSIQVHPGRFRSRPVGIGRIPWSGARRLRSGRARRPGVVNGVHASIDIVYSPFRQPRPYRTPGRPWRADIAIAGQARAAAVFCPPPFFFPSPLSGGRSGGGSRPWVRRVPPRPRAKRETGCGPSARQAGGTPAHPGNSRMSGIGKLPVRAAEPGQPPSRPPPFQGGGEKTQGGGEKTARPAFLFGHRERSPTGNPDSSPCSGKRSEDGVSSAITLGEAGRAGQSHLEISRRLADIAIAGQARAAAVFSPPPFFFPSPLSGGRSGGGSRPWERRRPVRLARSANRGAGLRPAKPAGRRRTRAVHG